VDEVPSGGERIRRARRPFWTAVKELPLDWLLERNRVPGLILGALVPISTGVGTVLGASLGNIFFFNWGLSLASPVALTARLFYRRVLDGYWTPSLWTRPQSHQKQDVAPAPEEPLELAVDTTGMSLPARKLMEFEAWLINTAETDPPSWKSRACGFVDDWLNERARTPGFIFSMTFMAVGIFVALPFTLLFPINLFLGGLPNLISLYLFKKTGDVYRFTRPGLHQRPKHVSLARRALGMEDFSVTGRTLAPQAEPAVVLSGSAQPVIRSPEPDMRVPVRQNRGAEASSLGL
jgi:ABC-type Fe3+ transport system permease subunit